LAVFVVAGAGAAGWRILSLQDRVDQANAHVEKLHQALVRARGVERRLVHEVKAQLRSMRQGRSSNQPCSPFGPHTQFFPSHGAPGTKVVFATDCLQGPAGMWHHWQSGYGMFLLHQFAQPRECELIIEVGHPSFRFDGRNRAHGSFVVPSGEGGCFQHDYRRAISPAMYRLGIGCHACEIGRFRVTAS
jgi:hypothetical protein